MEQAKNTSRLTADAFIMGIIGGAITALLLSPRSGAENRDRIKKAAKNTKAKMEARRLAAKEALESMKTKVHTKNSTEEDSYAHSHTDTTNTNVNQSNTHNKELTKAVENSKTSNQMSAEKVEEAKKEASKLP